MLDRQDDQVSLDEVLKILDCQINLPDSWDDYFEKVGLLATGPHDKRRCPRYHLRNTAAIQWRQTFPSLPRPRQWHRIYTKDVSRNGVSFLTSRQLFPRERIGLLLPPDRHCAIEVKRCICIQDRCFEIGARFIQDDSLQPT